MAANIRATTQRKILKLERRVFTLEQQIGRLKEKHEKEVAKLKAENQALRNLPLPVVSEEQRMRLIKLREQIQEKDRQKT